MNTYQDLLFDIQQNFEKNSKIVELLPSNDEIFDIDLESRTIEIPQFLSVRYDHNAEIIYFRCARYVDNMDLVNTVCIIEYINADGKPGLYWVPYYDIRNYKDDENDSVIVKPVIVIPWAISGLATAASGKITFAVRFYKLDADGKAFLYNMSTKPTTGEILHGMDLLDEELEDFKIEPDIVAQIYSDLKKVQDNAAIYWKDI